MTGKIWTCTVAVLLCLGLLGIPAGYAQQDLVPDVRINGADGPVVVKPDTNVNVTVSLDPGDLAGTEAEWWLAVYMPSSPIYDYLFFVYPDLWQMDMQPSLVGPIFELTPPFSVLDVPLPEGMYSFTFALDTNVNGVPDLMWYDFEIVQVGESTAYLLPDTAQDTCYSFFGEIRCPDPGEPLYGQDAQYQGPAPAYVDNGDGTVTDLNTGLMWQQGDDQNEEARAWEEACAYCESLELAGHSDWVLPEIDELATLPVYDVWGPAIDMAYFPECRRGPAYWSNTSTAGLPADAWVVDFDMGAVLAAEKIEDRSVRCVRRAAADPLGDSNGTRFIDNGDGTVSDMVVGNMWQQSDNGTPVQWEVGLYYCESLELGGHTDWRLPNARELNSIVDYTRSWPAVDPVFSAQSVDYWSSTTYIGYPVVAYRVEFSSGHMISWQKETTAQVRCVRGGLVESLTP